MKRARLGALVFSLLAAGGLIAGGISLALPGAANAAPPAHPVKTVVYDCPGQPALVKPRSFTVTCADGGIQYEQLKWASWTPGRARASGLLEENDCTPNCAYGHFHTYPATIVLSGNAALKNHPGVHCYTEMTVTLTGARPKYVHGLAPVTQIISLPTSPGLFPRVQQPTTA
jgi:hypothetical protein